MKCGTGLKWGLLMVAAAASCLLVGCVSGPRGGSWRGTADTTRGEEIGNANGQAEGWIDLFDGRSLEGWVRRGGQAEYAAEDGAIVGRTKPNQPNTFLCTLADYGDFELELEFKVDPELNSGVQIRSESVAEYRNGRVHGYQVEIDPSERAWTGGIYEEGRRGWLADLKGNPEARAAFRQGEWNRLRIVAQGDRIRTWLNGTAAADLTDPMTRTGFIALQVHGVGARAEPMEVRWRKIRLRILAPEQP